MMTSLQQKHGFKLEDSELEAYVRMEEDRVIAILEEKAEPCVGVNAVLESLHWSKKYGLAVVSSSALRRVRASLRKARQEKYFHHDHIFSAATSLPTPTSKPDPAIYLYACEVLGKSPDECVAIEDSKSGVTSAYGAGIRVLGYVGCYDEEKREEVSKVLRDAGAEVIMEDWSQFQACLEEIENNASAAGTRL
jgi:HAD superfamily hydrolase (TIGR01509 family)